MAEVVSTIVPIFAIVLLGWQARRKGFMPPEFLGPAMRFRKSGIMISELEAGKGQPTPPPPALSPDDGVDSTGVVK